MIALLLFACAAPDPSQWVGTWFGTVWWSEDDVVHDRTLLLEASATGERDVPVRAEGMAWAAHDADVVACDGIVGDPDRPTPAQRLLLVCELDRYASPVVLHVGGLMGDDHVEGRAGVVPDDQVAPPVSARSYDDWTEVLDSTCSVSLSHAVDGPTQRTLDSSRLVNFAEVDCTAEMSPSLTFTGEVDPSVTGLLLEFAIGGEVDGRAVLSPDDAGSLSLEGKFVGVISDECKDVTTSLYAVTGLQYQNMERIDL